MKCATTDKLSQYTDDLLEEIERIEVDEHIMGCSECKRVVETFRTEQVFLIETLQTPTLPEDFASLVIEKVEPYRQKTKPSKWKTWKRIFVSAAGIVLAFSLTATLNPSFAEWIGGLFGTEQVDEGLRIAADEGLAIRVNQEVTDQGLTFKIEDVVADSSRVALSYQVFNDTRELKDIHPDFFDSKNKVSIIDQNGRSLDISSMGWSGSSDYGYGSVELSLGGHENLEKLTVKFQLSELDGIQGNWDIEVPVDLNESLKLTTKFPLKGEISVDGVSVELKEAKLSPSSYEILYETSYTEEEQMKIENDIKQLKMRFGKEKIDASFLFETAIGYHLEKEDGKAIAYNNFFFEGKGHPSDQGLIQGSGKDMGEVGHMAWNEYFVPIKNKEKKIFVLDGVFKTVPSDFSIKIKPKELKKHPVSFEYEGNYLTIKKAEKQNNNSLNESLKQNEPKEKQAEFIVEMEGGKEAKASQFDSWLIVDNTGKVYQTDGGGSILDEKDEHGRFKTTLELRIEEMDEVPEELTLHLISVTQYTELKENKWKIPIN